MARKRMNKSPILSGSLATEFATIIAMVKIYCGKHHSGETIEDNELCSACLALINYAEQKLDRCPYGQHKPACKQCPIHCYKPEPKAQIRLVMRYAGPRMLLHHPILALRHLRHDKKMPSGKPELNASNRHQRQKKDNP